VCLFHLRYLSVNSPKLFFGLFHVTYFSQHDADDVIVTCW